MVNCKPFLVVFIALALENATSCNPNRNEIRTGLEGRQMPQMDFYSPEKDVRFRSDLFDNDRSFIVLYFSPTCPYCRRQIAGILRDMNSFSHFNVYLITQAITRELLDFKKKYELKKFANVTILIDDNSDFYSNFKMTGLPFLLIFTKNRILKKAFMGNTDLEAIKAAMSS